MPSDEYIDVRIRLKDARKFIGDAKKAGAGIDILGTKGKNAGRSFGLASRGLNLFRKGIGAAATTAKYGAAIIAASVTLAVRGSVNAFLESNAVMADQRQALKTTGHAARVTAKHLNAMAKAQSLRTGFDDEAIAKSQTLLLTFTKIQNRVGKGNKIFNQAAVAVQDYARRFDKDLNVSAIAVGKALNDPIRGVTALRKVGVSFTEQQQKQIKKLVESGRMLDAQKIILKELQVETGGAARVFGKTFAGAIARARVIVSNLAEVIGEKLAPYIRRAVNFVTRFIRLFRKGKPELVGWADAAVYAADQVTGSGGKLWKLWVKVDRVFRKTKTGVENLAAGFRDILIAFGLSNDKAKEGGDLLNKMGDKLLDVTAYIRDFGKWLRAGSDGAESFKVALISLTTAVAVYQAYVKLAALWSARAAIAQGAWNAAMALNPIGLIVAAIALVVVGLVLAYKKVGWFRKGVDAVANGAVKAFKWVWQTIKDVFGWVKKNWKLLVAIMLGPVGLIVYGITKHWDTIKQAFVDMINWIIRKWNAFAEKLSFDVSIGGRTYEVNVPTVGEIGGTDAAAPGANNYINRQPTARSVAAAPVDASALFAAAAGPAGTGGDIVLKVDGREIARVTAKEVDSARARR